MFNTRENGDFIFTDHEGVNHRFTGRVGVKNEYSFRANQFQNAEKWAITKIKFNPDRRGNQP